MSEMAALARLPSTFYIRYTVFSWCRLHISWNDIQRSIQIIGNDMARYYCSAV